MNPTISVPPASFKSRSLCAKALKKRPLGEVFHSSDDIVFEDILEIMEMSRQVRQMARPPLKRVRKSTSAPGNLEVADFSNFYAAAAADDHDDAQQEEDEEEFDSFFWASPFAMAMETLGMPATSRPVEYDETNDASVTSSSASSDSLSVPSPYSSNASFESFAAEQELFDLATQSAFIDEETDDVPSVVVTGEVIEDVGAVCKPSPLSAKKSVRDLNTLAQDCDLNDSWGTLFDAAEGLDVF
eukprot:gene13422-9612_t